MLVMDDVRAVGSRAEEIARAVLWAVAAAGFTASAYLLLLGWHAGKTVDPTTGNETGPYEAWQVILLCAAIGVISAVLGWLRLVVVAIVVVPVTVTALFAADSASSPDGDGLWAVGAVLVALGSFAGVALVSLLARRIPEHS